MKNKKIINISLVINSELLIYSLGDVAMPVIQIKNIVNSPCGEKLCKTCEDYPCNKHFGTQED